MPGAVALPPGAVIGASHRVVRPLDHGAMGAVYVAEQLATGALRALKIMRPDLVADERLLRLFEQEARIGHRIESDHVVHVVDAGVDEPTGMPWLAMELLEGENLEARLARSGLLAPALAADVLAQVGHALAAAHRVGVVHRDLKPGNVFLCRPRRDGCEVTVKVLDFGIARLVEEASPRETAPVGTPLWMAPEQARGRDVGAPADVWAFGLLAFWALTGRYYWWSGSTDAMPVLHEVLYADLPSASARAAEYGLERRIPPGFDAWFARCVARPIEARFPDAGAAREELRRVLAAPDPPPVSARPPDPPPAPAVIWAAAEPQPPGSAYDRAWYVPREREEREAQNYLAFAGKPAILWGPSRVGKTWLLDRCVDHLRREEGFEAVLVNPRLLGRASLDELLQGIAEQIIDARDAPPESLSAAWSRPGSAAARLTRMLERLILPTARSPLVLAIDGADLVWGTPFQDDFFALLRAWAEAYHEPWPRLRLALTVSTTPALLVGDPNRSPFNLTSPIVIGDLGPEQVEDLARRYRLAWGRDEVAALMDLVGGHPYLARLLMHRASLHRTPLAELLDPALGARWILFEDVRRLRAWLERSGFSGVAARLAREPGGRLAPDEHHRAVRAGLAVEAEGGGLRLRNRLYAIAAEGA